MAQKLTVTTVELVTPEQAERWLAEMVKNRPLREDRVYRYARDMEAGNWKLSGQTIKFGKDGKLLDGQHRLTALTLAKKTVLMEITRDVDASAIPIIDEGGARSVSDALAFRGREYYINVAGALGVVWRILTDNVHKNRRQPSRRELTALDSVIGDELVELVRTFYATGESRDTYIPASVLAGVGLVAYRINKTKAKEFLDACVHWRQLPDGHPCVALNKRFINAKAGRFKFGMRDKLGACIRAWNAFVSGQTRAKISSSRRTEGALAWPEMKGLDAEKVGAAMCPGVFRPYKADGIADALEKAAMEERNRVRRKSRTAAEFATAPEATRRVSRA